MKNLAHPGPAMRKDCLGPVVRRMIQQIGQPSIRWSRTSLPFTLLLLVLAVASTACKKSDAAVEDYFHENHEKLQTLVSMLTQDTREGSSISFIQEASGVARLSSGQLSGQRQKEYEELLVSLKDITLVGGGSKRALFRLQLIGEFEKGLIYDTSSVAPLLPELNSFRPLEQYRTSKYGNFLGYKRIDANWYVYAHYD